MDLAHSVGQPIIFDPKSLFNESRTTRVKTYNQAVILVFKRGLRLGAAPFSLRFPFGFGNIPL